MEKTPSKIRQKIKKEREAVGREVRNKIVTYITAGFGLVAGLAWNDAIKSLIEYLFPAGGNTMLAKFVYALVFTIILAVITIYLSRLLLKEERTVAAEKKETGE
jgi:hypothetical protein